MSSYYCLVTSDTETKFARDIINSRLKEKKYPLYKKTPFLNEIKKNDEVVFYLAGKGENSQSFVATAKILSIETINNTAVIDPDNMIDRSEINHSGLFSETNRHLSPLVTFFFISSDKILIA